MNNFNDIIKGKFLEEFSALSLGDAMTAIALAFVLSLFIVFVYRVTYAGVNYSKSFAGCMIMLSMVTTVMILVISSNVVLSLGMVGALSIVRFRTAVKEPADTAFLFWAIATGIICGAGYVTLSVLMTLLLGVLFVAMFAFGKSQKTNSYMVVVRYEGESEVEKKLSELPGYRLKNKSMNMQYTEVVAEVRIGANNMKRVNALKNIEGVKEISIMASVSGSVL